MKPERRAQLDDLIAHVRQAAEARRRAIAATSDEALMQVTGIPDAALSRRVAATDRVALRLSLPEPALERLDDNAEQAPPPSDLATDGQHEPQALTDPAPTDDTGGAEAMLEALACAIGFSVTPDWPDTAALLAARQRHGDEAVAFALAHRADVPGWMRLSAGVRADVHRQFAATALRAVDDLPARWHLLADHFDPMPVSGEAARREIGSFVERASRFLRLAGPQSHQNAGET